MKKRNKIGSCKKITEEGTELLRKNLQGITSLKKFGNTWDWEDE